MASEDHPLILNTEGMNNLNIAGPGKTLVTLKEDGSIVYGPNYTPEEAARLFWEMLADANPLKQQLAHARQLLEKFIMLHVADLTIDLFNDLQDEYHAFLASLEATDGK